MFHYDTCLLPWTRKSFWNRSYFYRNDLLFQGDFFFLFREAIKEMGDRIFFVIVTSPVSSPTDLSIMYEQQRWVPWKTKYLCRPGFVMYLLCTLIPQEFCNMASQPCMGVSRALSRRSIRLTFCYEKKKQQQKTYRIQTDEIRTIWNVTFLLRCTSSVQIWMQLG